MAIPTDELARWVGRLTHSNTSVAIGEDGQSLVELMESGAETGVSITIGPAPVEEQVLECRFCGRTMPESDMKQHLADCHAPQIVLGMTDRAIRQRFRAEDEQ